MYNTMVTSQYYIKSVSAVERQQFPAQCIL